MAETLAQIDARMRTEYPTLKVVVNGVESVLGQAAYDARIAEMAQFVLAGQLADEAEAARKDMRRQVRLALTALDADIVTLNTGSPTLAQMRPMLERTDRTIVGLIRALIDLRLIEQSD
jgi:hypothetical protein